MGQHNARICTILSLTINLTNNLSLSHFIVLIRIGVYNNNYYASILIYNYLISFFVVVYMLML